MKIVSEINSRVNFLNLQKYVDCFLHSSQQSVEVRLYLILQDFFFFFLLQPPGQDYTIMQ